MLIFPPSLFTKWKSNCYFKNCQKKISSFFQLESTSLPWKHMPEKNWLLLGWVNYDDNNPFERNVSCSCFIFHIIELWPVSVWCFRSQYIFLFSYMNLSSVYWHLFFLCNYPKRKALARQMGCCLPLQRHLYLVA